MTGRHLVDFVLAVAVERGPRDAIRGIGICGGRPVEFNLGPSMSNRELAAFMRHRKTYDETTDLILATLGVNMCLEFTARSAVDIELIELSLTHRVSDQKTCARPREHTYSNAV